MRTAQVQVRFQIQFKYTVQVLPLYSRLFRQAGNTVGILPALDINDCPIARGKWKNCRASSHCLKIARLGKYFLWSRKKSLKTLQNMQKAEITFGSSKKLSLFDIFFYSTLQCVTAWLVSYNSHCITDRLLLSLLLATFFWFATHRDRTAVLIPTQPTTMRTLQC